MNDTCEWVKAISRKRAKNLVYYFNIKTGESVWEAPPGVEIFDSTRPTSEDPVSVSSNSYDSVKEEQKEVKEIEDDCDDKIWKKFSHHPQIQHVSNLSVNSGQCTGDSRYSSPTRSSTSEKVETTLKTRNNLEETCCKELINKNSSNCDLKKSNLQSTGNIPKHLYVGGDVRLKCSDTKQEITKTYKEEEFKRRNSPSNIEVKDLPYANQQQWSNTHHKVSKTPIQDRFDKKKEELLKKQKDDLMKKPKPPNKISCESFQCTVSAGTLKRKSCPNNTDKISCESFQCTVSAGTLKRKSCPNTTGPTKRSREEDTSFKQSSGQSSSLTDGSTFDLRKKIQERKRTRLSSHSSNESEPTPMDCEDHYQPDVINANSRHEDCSEVIEGYAPTIPYYKLVYLVCDTSVLIDDHILLEQLINKGSYFGLPVKIVIPFVVFSELDKVKIKDNVGYKARYISRMIKSSQQSNSSHLQFQDGSKSRDPVGSLELKNNDDHILNCSLQTKEKCGKDELVMLMTSDNNLTNKAISFKVDAHSWGSFKKWARGYKEKRRSTFLNKKRHVPVNDTKNVHQSISCQNSNYNLDCTNTYESMDVDGSEMDTKVTKPIGISTNEPLTEIIKKSPECTAKPSQLQNSIRSILEELKLDFQDLLHAVLDEALEKMYGPLKRFSIKPMWTLFQLIQEVRRRWNVIMPSNASLKTQELFSKLIPAYKKLNSGREDLTEEDVENIFDLSSELAKIFLEGYPKHAQAFLDRMDVQRLDWNEARKSNSSTNSCPHSSGDESLQAVDVSLQHIYTCLSADYDEWKKKMNKSQSQMEKNDLKNGLSSFFMNLSQLTVVLRSVFHEEIEKLNGRNEKVVKLHKLVSNYSNGTGTTFGFDMSVENVIELFQDTFYRKKVEEKLGYFIELQDKVDELLNSIDDN